MSKATMSYIVSILLINYEATEHCGGVGGKNSHGSLKSIWREKFGRVICFHHITIVLVWPTCLFCNACLKFEGWQITSCSILGTCVSWFLSPGFIQFLFKLQLGYSFYRRCEVNDSVCSLTTIIFDNLNEHIFWDAIEALNDWKWLQDF